MSPSPTVLGLDIGGSKTHAQLRCDGVLLAEYVLPSANIASVGEAQASELFAELAATIAGDGGGNRIAPVQQVFAGAAGADSPEAAAALQRVIAAAFPHAEVTVVHDAFLVLGAAGLDTGIVIIGGTGSVAWGRRDDGLEARAGGWGYLLGDEGSGYDIVRSAMQALLADADAGKPLGRLGSAVLRAAEVDEPDEVLAHFYRRPDRKFWASMASVVFEQAAQGDAQAEAILAKASGSLAELATNVARRLEINGPVVLAGGILVHQARAADGVTARLAEAGVTDVRVLESAPVIGAFHLASRAAARA